MNKISMRFEAAGFTEEKVELEHLRTIIKEMDRETKVMDSVRADNKRLREQVARQDEQYRSLEASRAQLELTRVEQARQIE